MFSRMPPPTSFCLKVKVPPVEFKTVMLSSIVYPSPPSRGIYIELLEKLNSKLPLPAAAVLMIVIRNDPVITDVPVSLA